MCSDKSNVLCHYDIETKCRGSDEVFFVFLRFGNFGWAKLIKAYKTV